MELFLDCIPCMIRQALEASRMVTDNEEEQAFILKEALKITEQYQSYRNSPDLARTIHQFIKEKTQNKDPYKQIKQKDLAGALKAYPTVVSFLNDKKDRLYWALKASAAGNNIDAAIYKDLDIGAVIKAELDKKFAYCDIEMFKQKLENASMVLVLGDNAGETVFDKILMEQLLIEKSDINIIYGVRSEPVLNDTTIEEAKESGIEETAQIISTGCNAPGVILDYCSDEFRGIFNKADIIISKGQGNFEALSEEKGPIFFLLKAKCPMIARKLEINLNGYVLKCYEKSKHSDKE